VKIALVGKFNAFGIVSFRQTQTNIVTLSYKGNSHASHGETGVNPQQRERYSIFPRALRIIRNTMSPRKMVEMWPLFEHNPLLPLGALGQWDEVYASWASIVSTAPRKWRMYYSGKDKNGHLRIGLALSENGVHWEKYVNNPIVDIGEVSDWDARYVYCPVVWVEGNCWMMIFTGSDSLDHYQIGVASSDDGITWSKSKHNPVFCDSDPDRKNAFGMPETEGWGFMKQNDQYLLLYNSVTIKPREVHVAESTDLFSWRRASSAPLLSSEGAPNDLGYMKYCAWPHPTGRRYLIFAATSNRSYTKSAIGLWKTSSLLSDRPVFVGYVLKATKGWCERELDTPFVMSDEEAGILRMYCGGRSRRNEWSEGLATGTLAEHN
jgi:predicted GH43/DUF377 family glycosyl hydrolase